jgi:hypothetical protein
VSRPAYWNPSKGRRAILGATAIAAALVLAGWGPTPAQATTTCTWAGTPAAPTGTFTLSPGITNTPSTRPLEFKAIGELAGGCTGKLTFDGVFHAGATCAAFAFSGRAKGLPGVVRFAGVVDGPNPSLVPPARLYDREGNIVGYEQPQILTQEAGDSHLADCNTPEGFTHGHFSSVVVLF